jgi:hypothetical protein
MADEEPKALFEMSREELLQHVGTDPGSWACHGVGMMRAAYVMWGVFWERLKRMFHGAHGKYLSAAEHTHMATDRYVHAYRLLVGVALESLVKGLIVGTNGIQLDNGSLPPWLLSHNTVALISNRTNFTPTDQEVKLLERSAKAVIWQTRYPVPKGPGALPGQYPANELGQAFAHPYHFRDLAKRILGAFPPGQLRPDLTDSLRAILDHGCPAIERLVPERG